MKPIKLKNISLSYYNNPALKVEDFYADAPFAIIGGAGSGKTNILKVIAGLERIDSGEIFIGENEVGGDRIKKRNISLISPNTPFIKSKSIYKNLIYPLAKRGIKNIEIGAYLQDLGVFLTDEIKENYSNKISKLSAAGRDELILARALIKQPDLVLIDEPVGLIQDTALFINRLKTSSVMFILATYDFELAYNAGIERFVILKRGNIVFDGSYQEIQQTDDKYVRLMCFPKENAL